MSKKNKKKDRRWILAIAALVVLVIALALISAFFDLVYNFVMDNPWIFLIVPAAAIGAFLYYNRKKKEQRAREEKQRQQEQEQRGRHIQQMLTHRDMERKTQEDNRVQAILSHRAEWGDDMCQWMIANHINPHKPATINIMNRYPQWGRDNCQRLLQQKIEVGMTDEMIQAAYGRPPIIDEKETTARDEKCRYVYGRPRRDATYIWFKNGVVTRIKQ